MKKRYFTNKNGDRLEVVKLTPEEKHELRQKNLKLLREQRLFEETVQYADYQLSSGEDTSDSRTCPRTDRTS